MSEQEAPTKASRKPRQKAPELPPSADADRSKLTQYQKFNVRRMSRSLIQGAPYNPRLITPQAKKRLERNLRNPKVGLLEPLCWNEVTGNLVSGHQRLATLDVLEGRGDYEMDVAVVQLDEKTEREQNAFMNNPGAMGTWDIDALGKMGFRFEGGTFDWQAAGFDKIDLEDMFSGTQYGADMESLFASAETSKGAAETLAGMADMGAIEALPSDDAPPGDKHVVAFMAGAAGQEGPKGAQQAIAAFRAQEHINNQIKADKEDTETFAVVLFPSRVERDKFMVQCGQPVGERYIDIATLVDALGLKLS